MTGLAKKLSGAYYTPDDVSASLVRWVVRRDSDRLLDPSCGDGRFVALHRQSVGVEQDAGAAQTAMQRAPWALVHEGDFFSWAAHTAERFECAAGNPPFIRYQSFKGINREMAKRYCASLGVHVSGLSSSWAPFLVATASLLKAGGRMAFVVPAEIGHAPYAAPVLEYLCGRFSTVQVVAIRHKLFPELSEDCWLLYADGCGERTETIQFTALEHFTPQAEPPPVSEIILLEEWRNRAGQRLRSYLLPASIRELYFRVAEASGTQRLEDVARVGIGYVSGANEFFHLRPSEAEQWGIPRALLQPTVRNGRRLAARRLDEDTVRQWLKDDEQVLLLRLAKQDPVPAPVKRYLDSEVGQQVRQRYKCRVRNPWYAVPDVQTPDFFLSYMSGRQANLVRNEAACTGTNSVHTVRLRAPLDPEALLATWYSPFTQLSCELEGHALGGGMLKLEPREAQRVVFGPPEAFTTEEHAAIVAGLHLLRAWRHLDEQPLAEHSG